MAALLGAVEAGGTKFVVAVGQPGAVLAEATIPTRGPGETLAEVADFFAAQWPHGPLAAVGVAAFGPVDVDPASMSWGHIQDTPKRAWAGFDLAGAVADAAGAPVVLETDVGAAALAEAAIAGGEALVAYATVGTGIGVGLAQGGRVLRGKRHGEGGHVPILPHAAMGKSVCPFHADCLEGLASGPAIQSHWGAPLDRLPEDHAGRAAIADALAQLCVGLLYAVSPDRIVLGGGVMTGGALLPAIRAAAQARMGGYHVPPGGLDAVITGPRSAIAPGLAGALLLAERAA